MECKIFASSSLKDLEEKVNEWLQRNPVSPESMRFQFSATSLNDPIDNTIEHTVVLFYVPMRAINF